MWSLLEALPQVLSLLNLGSNSYWFGLSCPAHCQASFTFNLALLVSGFGLGCLVTLAFVWAHLIGTAYLRPAEASPSPRAQVSRTGAPRLFGFLAWARSPTWIRHD